jgi:hypothetical protein
MSMAARGVVCWHCVLARRPPCASRHGSRACQGSVHCWWARRRSAHPRAWSLSKDVIILAALVDHAAWRRPRPGAPARPPRGAGAGASSGCAPACRRRRGRGAWRSAPVGCGLHHAEPVRPRRWWAGLAGWPPGRTGSRRPEEPRKPPYYRAHHVPSGVYLGCRLVLMSPNFDLLQTAIN